MFDRLSEKLTKTIRKLAGKDRITENNIKDALKEVKKTLLSADVALSVTDDFLHKVQERAIGKEVMSSISPGQALVKVVRDELVDMMGKVNTELDLKAQPPAVVLMAGLQGSGKTTTSAKLAVLLQTRQKKTVLLVSTDVYRPAAIEQLHTLAKDNNIAYFPSHASEKPTDIAKAALDFAKKQGMDVLIIDTAGRLHIDQDMMAEIQALHKAVNPVETLFVVDSMTGQDAANTAKAFHEALPLTGIILTKTDGDARGGAALSMRSITGKPIKFIGTSEKIDGLEAFHPDRISSRILGMGDVLSLIEEAERKVDKVKAQKLAKKMQTGTFNLNDFREQLAQMHSMGGMKGLMDKLPMMPGMNNAPSDILNDKQTLRMQAMIDSMTKSERRNPDLINGSRKVRITKGSGTNVHDLNRLLKQFKQMQKMMKRFSGKGGMMNMLRMAKNILPPGGMPTG